MQRLELVGTELRVVTRGERLQAHRIGQPRGHGRRIHGHGCERLHGQLARAFADGIDGHHSRQQHKQGQQAPQGFLEHGCCLLGCIVTIAIQTAH